MHLEKAENIHCRFKKPKGVLGKDWHVFDGDVCIDENVVEHYETLDRPCVRPSFTLKARPVGEV